MKKVWYLWVLLLLYGCESRFDVMDDAAGMHSCKIRLDASLQGYDSNPNRGDLTRSSWVWPDGARLLLYFNNNKNVIQGVATYSQPDDEWSLEYTGALTETEKAKVDVYYIPDAERDKDGVLELSEKTCIYKDGEGVYSSVGDDELRISANLSPLYGRVRFKGVAGKAVQISGIMTGRAFDVEKHEIQGSLEPLSLQAGQDGYTGYVYGIFPEDRRVLYVESDGYSFASTCPANILEAGKSGWMGIPTALSHEGWTFFHLDVPEELTSKPVSLVLGIDSREEWNISLKASSSWIGIEKAEGCGSAEVRLDVSDNASLNSRTDTVVVTSANGLMMEFPVNQSGKHFDVSLDKLLVDYNAEYSETVVVETDGDYEVGTDANWLTICDKTEQSFRVRMDGNSTGSSREARIVARLILDSGESLEKEISLVQAAFGHGYRNGWEFVDLGLPSGRKWAVCNIGAKDDSWLGDPFAWGETTTKSTFSWDNYKYGYSTPAHDGVHEYFITITKYSSWGAILSDNDDAAHVIYGEGWNIPSKEEWKELINNCKWSNGTESRFAVKGVGPNGCYLLLPTTSGVGAYYWANSVANYSRYENGVSVKYFYYANCANPFVSTYSSGVREADVGQYRCYGKYIRPVLR